MRKKTILAIIALIGLSSFVVLGSSPELVDKLLESLQDNPIIRVFSSDVQTKSRKSSIEFAEKAQKSEIIQKSDATRASLSSNEVSDMLTQL